MKVLYPETCKDGFVGHNQICSEKMKQQSLLLPFEYLFAEKFLVKFLVLIFWLSFKH